MPSSKADSVSSNSSESETEEVVAKVEPVLLESSPSTAHIEVELVKDKEVPEAKDTLSEVDPDELKKHRDTESNVLGAEFDGLTVYEKKSLLINKRLDEMGMGRYQWCLYFLCGGGYFLDLMWAMILGLIAPSIVQELGIPDKKFSEIFVAFSVGMTVGAFFWGFMVDIVGRSWAFNITISISSVFGTLIGAPSNWGAICFFSTMLGIGIGGNIPIDSTVLLEFLPQNRRFLLASLSVFQPLGVMAAAIISFLLIPKNSCFTKAKSCDLVASGVACCTRSSNMGWRYAVFVVGGITILLFIARFFLFKFVESPKFYLSKGRDQDAINSVLAVAKFNRMNCDLTMDHLKDCEKFAIDSDAPVLPLAQAENKFMAIYLVAKQKIKESNFRGLFANKTMIRLTILTWITYAFDFWGFSIAGSFMPLILRRKGLALAVPLEVTFRNTIIIYSCGVPGVLLSLALIEAPRIGRKWGMVISSALMAISLFLFAVVSTTTALVAFNALEYFAQSLFNAILYAWTPEAFPAPIRGTACGLASTTGRLMGIISKLIAGQLLAAGATNGILYLAGSGVFICTIAMSFLPYDTKGKQTF